MMTLHERVETDEVQVDPMAQLPELPVIELARPMPGFPDERRFALVRLDDEGLLCEFRSLDHEDLRFLVVHPGAFFPDYAPVLADEDAELVELTSSDDALVLVILNPGASVAETTANLVAPIVVNTVNRRAAQVVLNDSALSVAAPLPA